MEKGSILFHSTLSEATPGSRTSKVHGLGRLSPHTSLPQARYE